MVYQGWNIIGLVAVFVSGQLLLDLQTILLGLLHALFCKFSDFTMNRVTYFTKTFYIKGDVIEHSNWRRGVIF